MDKRPNHLKSFLSLAVIWIAGLSLSFTACTAQTTPGITPTPTCYPKPQPTGEKIIKPTVETRPPVQVSPGQVVKIVFSGGYVILNNAITCGETVVRYMHSDELPSFDWTRTVEVLLDGNALTTAECEYTCEIDAKIPEDVKPGTQKLVLDTNYWEDVVFEIQVVKP
jgi:hypothetical protein